MVNSVARYAPLRQTIVRGPPAENGLYEAVPERLPPKLSQAEGMFLFATLHNTVGYELTERWLCNLFTRE